MTKSELVKKVQETLELKSQKAAAEMLDKVMGVIIDAVKSGEELAIADLGKFETVTRAERKGVRPDTKEAITIPAKKTIKFKVSNKLKKAINE